MVVFTCGHCGESVTKPKVEKHYMTKCRNRSPNLSCMDCFKDFLGNAYEEHIKCITEAERYSAKGFVAKEKKGEKKQSNWVEMVQSVLDEQENAPKNVLRIIESISKHNNTPRKKPKFVNFVKNVCGHKTNPKDIDQAWEMISVKLIALSGPNQNRNQKNNEEQDKDDGNDNDKENNEEEDEGKEPEVEANGEVNGEENGEEANEAVANGHVKERRLSKKEKKEEKKRRKYEAELQSAEAPLSEEEEVVVETTKKGKKKNKKNDDDGTEEGKKNKRKRQDTVNSVTHEPVENGPEPVQNGTGKVQKKKAKINVAEEEEDSMCLHDQNVAKIGELAVNEQFNWHAVIMSVLEKKGNELPFKRLQKKVLAEYSEITGHDVDDRIADKFIKKLKSAPNVKVDKNRVSLEE